MIKQQILRFTNSLLRPLGAEIVKVKSASGISNYEGIDPSSHYMKDKGLRRLLTIELSDIAQNFFRNQMKSNSFDKIDLHSEVENFMTIYSNRPLKENKGGSGFHNAFWLFLFARAIDASLIVESGIWKGHTTWLLEQACPDAKILGFDINLNRFEYKNLKARFYEYDWSDYDFKSVDPERSFIFFDCHVNHAKRIFEACDRGFKHLIFDDNPPAHILYGHDVPGFPTANMVWSKLEIESSDIEWYWRGKEKSYKINKDEIKKAKNLLRMHEVFPNIGDFTKYGGFSYLTYVNIENTEKAKL